jgi:hypothetical protein
MPGQRRHVTQRPDGQWADKAEGAERAGGLNNTQAEAQAAATQHLQNHPGGGDLLPARVDRARRRSSGHRRSRQSERSDAQCTRASTAPSPPGWSTQHSSLVGRGI